MPLRSASPALASAFLLVFVCAFFTWHPVAAQAGAALFVRHLQTLAALRTAIPVRSVKGMHATEGSALSRPALPAAAPSEAEAPAHAPPVVGVAQWTAAALALCAAALAVVRRRPSSPDCLADLESPLLMAAAAGVSGRKVAVTGAAGRTGKLVVQRLLELRYTPVCVVKSDKSAQALRKLGVPASGVRLVSVTDSVQSLTEAFAGCDAVILCTSAVPKIQLLSIVKIFFRKCFGRQPGRPTFTFPEGGRPEEVDWVGTRNQVDAAKAAGVSHFVMVSSMGGTQPDNFLNTIGKKPDGTGGDILLWKRKGEQYLIQSGLKYTIVHPGGLLDQAGGKRELVFGVDDELLKEKVRSIPRADVAEVCVQALNEPGAANRSIDVISRPEGEGQPTTDFAAFFANPGNCKY
eukprot:EG_transcript_13034